MDISRIQEKLRFLEEINNYKTIARVMPIPWLDRNESDAEHSWHLAVFVMLLAWEYPELDEKKCLQFALIHDLPELYAGDALPWENISEKHEKERLATEKLLAILWADDKFEKLFAEYEDRASAEARFVYELDKIIPYVACYLCNWSHLHDRKLTYFDIVPINRGKISKEFWLDELFEYYAARCHESGCFYEWESDPEN